MQTDDLHGRENGSTMEQITKKSANDYLIDNNLSIKANAKSRFVLPKKMFINNRKGKSKKQSWALN